jgi:predicted ribosomally synthesized peptide with SipW-like signal peptide
MLGLQRLPERIKVFGSSAVLIHALVVTVSLATATTYALWTSTTSAGGQVASGTVTIALGATGASTNRLTVNASAIAPGDTIKRSVDLINSGSIDLASVTLTTTATVSSALDTDAVDGLWMKIDRCSVAWTETGSSPSFSYSCGGSTSAVLANQAIIGANLALGNLTSTTAGNTDRLLVTITFPGGSGTTLQGKSSTIQYAFTGTQRAGTAR